MIVAIILAVLFIGGILLAKYSYDYETTGVVVSVIAGIILVVHLMGWACASYDYNVLVAKREAIVQTIEEARKNNNRIELAAVTNQIIEWNKELAEAKYQRTSFFLKSYVDKRVETLQFIH